MVGCGAENVIITISEGKGYLFTKPQLFFFFFLALGNQLLYIKYI